ncbi:hypothetical protein ACIQU4_41040 [Streptomyces sp. NPDC090741]|uniref:hypothetical protein n=1 Tax=Streptomyces sp. NPDC090741 TaxID=3365967 RepID=UPI0037F7D69C
MITVRAALGTPRTRRMAGPLQLLWLAALLLAFLYTHAAGADSASAHVTGGAVTVPHLTPTGTDSAEHHDGSRHERRDDGGAHSHPAQECASGHPHQGCDLPGPTLVSLRERTDAVAAPTPQPWTRTPHRRLPPLRSSLTSVVQQV